MGVNRRDFLKIAASVSAAVGTGVGAASRPKASEPPPTDPENMVGCLVDTTRCIGCRKCEEACNKANHLPIPSKPFWDQSVFEERRRPTDRAFTVVNAYPGPPSPKQDDRKRTTVKIQCMHCLDPACVSACIVGALTKDPTGPVVYNPSRCMGCRYCMIACPFEIPAYEYTEPLVPKVRKCTYCVNEKEKTGANPACAKACPTEAILFDKREKLLAIAHERIKRSPDRYINHIYGEKEVGGTSWLYLSGRPFEELGFLKLPEKAPPRLTESIQHGIFKYGAAPTLFYAGLGGLWWLTARANRIREAQNASSRTAGEKTEEQETPLQGGSR